MCICESLDRARWIDIARERGGEIEGEREQYIIYSI